jgi:hypothetical protein
MASPVGACFTVAKGGVGESGASSFITHKIAGQTSKIIVLRTVDSSLCPNTGVVALLVVNGIHFTSGRITAKGSTLQTDAKPGDQVTVIVHTIPLFNEVMCIRLGELDFILEECQLEVAAEGQPGPASHLATSPPTGPLSGRSVSTASTRDWYAWNNVMPPGPNQFHIVGEVEVPNPGVDVLLVPRTPQGINPRVLLLDLHLIQRPGLWPQIVVWKHASYKKVNATYDKVQVFSGIQVIADVPVETAT